MMPDELRPNIQTIEDAITALNAEVVRRQEAEARAEKLSAENLVLRGQLCQCRLDPEVEV